MERKSVVAAYALVVILFLTTFYYYNQTEKWVGLYQETSISYLSLLEQLDECREKLREANSLFHQSSIFAWSDYESMSIQLSDLGNEQLDC